MRFGITMDNLNIDNVQLDLDTLLRFVCAYALNDTHVSQTIIASSFESLPDQIKSFGLLVEFIKRKNMNYFKKFNIDSLSRNFQYLACLKTILIRNKKANSCS